MALKSRPIETTGLWLIRLCLPRITVAVFRRVAAGQLSVMFGGLGVVTLRYRLPGRGLLPGTGYGEEAGAVVVPAGGGLVAPPSGGPAQGEGQPGAGDDPGGVLRGKAGQPGGLGDRQLDESDSAGAGLAAAGGHRRVAEGDHQVSVVSVTVVAVILGRAGPWPPGAGGRVISPCRAPRMAMWPELREGGQGGVPADPVPCPGLGLVPAQHVLSRFERFLSQPPLIPVKKKSSLAFRVHPGRY